MHTKTTLLTFTLPLALALGVAAHAQPAGSGVMGAIGSIPPAGTVQPGATTPPAGATSPAGTAPPAATVSPNGAVGAMLAFGSKLKASPPNGCAKQWVIDGKNGLYVLDERGMARKQQLLALASALPQAPKDKRLNREEYDSATATATRLKALELEMSCDATNRHAFAKENLGWDKTKETAANRGKNAALVNAALMDAEKTRREILGKLQQITAANANATGGAAR
jgi:hypothetical protein